MDRKYPHLSSPLKIGNAILRNRIVPPHVVSDIRRKATLTASARAFYNCGEGGAAAVTVSECVVHPKTARATASHR
jgi:2,4-dienoyl-CoA reductase-like NADH-dependent reductase (Old Yellow Enzyme family)